MRFTIAAVLLMLPSSVEAGELRVTVDGIRSPHGTVLIGLYDSAGSFEKAVESSAEEGFLIDPDRFGAVALRANAALRSAVVFSNLAPGRYAAIAFHDENGNGKLDTNLMGMPIERYGFSNDAKGNRAAPDFEAAAIAVDADLQTVIHLR